MKTGYLVSDCMSQTPLTTAPTTSIRKCAGLMKKNKVGSIVVVDNNKKPLGIVTNQDIVFRVVSKGTNLNEPVSKFMSTTLIRVKPEEDIFSALEVMNKNMIRHLNVIRGGELVGFLTLKDILKIEPALFDLYVGKIDGRIEGNNNINPLYENDGICAICGNYTKSLTEVNGIKVCALCKNNHMT
jgi:signal-transduction protein with cAMP-binding, CBS, and nucleotidyltransferase domain